MTGGLQSQVNVVQAPAVEGDFCTTNPRKTFQAGQFGLVAGPNGVTIGRFAWAIPPGDNDDGPTLVNNYGFGPPTGLLHRDQTGLITTYLADSGELTPLGFACTLFTDADLWVKNNGTVAALFQNKAYAKYADGTIRFGVTGSPTSGGSGTSCTIAAETFSVTGTISNGILTVTVVGSGTLYPGSTITGTGIPGSANAGVTILSQLTGTTGGVGTYLLSSNSFTVSTSETISGTYGLLTVGGTVTSGFAVNQLINGSGVAANTFITALGTGTGGAGTYIVNNNTVVGSGETITSYVDIETKYYAISQGAVGSLVKITSTLGS